MRSINLTISGLPEGVDVKFLGPNGKELEAVPAQNHVPNQLVKDILANDTNAVKEHISQGADFNSQACDCGLDDCHQYTVLAHLVEDRKFSEIAFFNSLNPTSPVDLTVARGHASAAFNLLNQKQDALLLKLIESSMEVTINITEKHGIISIIDLLIKSKNLTLLEKALAANENNPKATKINLNLRQTAVLKASFPDGLKAIDNYNKKKKAINNKNQIAEIKEEKETTTYQTMVQEDKNQSPVLTKKEMQLIDSGNALKAYLFKIFGNSVQLALSHSQECEVQIQMPNNAELVRKIAKIIKANSSKLKVSTSEDMLTLKATHYDVILNVLKAPAMVTSIEDAILGKTESNTNTNITVLVEGTKEEKKPSPKSPSNKETKKKKTTQEILEKLRTAQNIRIAKNKREKKLVKEKVQTEIMKNVFLDDNFSKKSLKDNDYDNNSNTVANIPEMQQVKQKEEAPPVVEDKKARCNTMNANAPTFTPKSKQMRAAAEASYINSIFSDPNLPAMELPGAISQSRFQVWFPNK